ncbi:uncharacterized protein LOC131208420 [Anopheles bellator]|uniref:uncharacterized protein LOC131208420 n=1 Tax=Anopheles bellator TaxID=139047 RepID=UPI0026497543|nr:uncharacterized protein LOC131208420 [Anopheles bellator]
MTSAVHFSAQHYLVFFAGLAIVLCSLLGDAVAASGSAGGGASGVAGGGRGSGPYNYGTGVAGGSIGGLGGGGMRRGVYGPVGLGNPHDIAPRYAAAPGSSAQTQAPGPGKSSHHRLSAWGIITIVTFVILIGAGAYWGFICYPFFCKKERNYNMMLNMSSATTATPSTRSTEFEKLDHCCSKSTTSTRSNDTGISNI